MASLVMTTYKIIACSTIRDEVETLRGDIPVEYLEGFLHDTPDVLRERINERIAATPGDCTILLAYGRCSNGTAGLVAGPHRLVLPACDDCIALLLGSRRAYMREFAEHPGTYYYTRGWIEELEDPYREYLKMIPRMGEEKSRMVAHMILEAYTRVAVIDTGTYDLEKAQAYVDTVAEFYGLPITGSTGSLRLLEKLIRGPHDEEFIIIEPGEELEERVFWDMSATEPARGDAAEPARRGEGRPRTRGLPAVSPCPSTPDERRGSHPRRRWSAERSRQDGEVRGREHRRHPQYPVRMGSGDGVEADPPVLLHRLVRHQSVPRAQGRRRAHRGSHRGPRLRERGTRSSTSW